MTPYWQLFYHLVWATGDHRPWLVEETEALIHGYVRDRVQALGGSVFAIGGMEEHLHLVAAIPPRIAVATFVGQVKSGSSARYNRRFPDGPRFFWHTSYGVFTFDRKRLANAIDYVQNQARLHAEDAIIPVLERMDGGAPDLILQPETGYYIDSVTWRNEMLALDTELFT
jgi:REP element-mobilizing transposase RayT